MPELCLLEEVAASPPESISLPSAGRRTGSKAAALGEGPIDAAAAEPAGHGCGVHDGDGDGEVGGLLDDPDGFGHARGLCCSKS